MRWKDNKSGLKRIETWRENFSKITKKGQFKCTQKRGDFILEKFISEYYGKQLLISKFAVQKSPIFKEFGTEKER